MRHRYRIGALLVSVLLLVGWLFGQPAGTSPARGDTSLRRVVPLEVDLLPAPGSPQPAGDPWRLFDRDTERGFSPPGEEAARVRLRLDRARPLAAIGVYGPAEGQVRVLARRGSEWLPLHELDLRGLNAGWHRTDLAETVTARALLVEWQPFSAGAALPEIELWTADSGDGRHTATAVPAGPDAFLVQLDQDPAAFSRAFLTYELDGLAHWTGVRRSINSLPAQGGFAPAEAQGRSTQTEEINPHWLARGLNEVRFQQGDTPYTVHNLRIVLVEDGGRDGRLDRAWNGQAEPAVDLRFRTPSQPFALELAVAGQPTGELSVDALLRDGSAVPASRPVDLGSLDPGSSRIALDGPPDALGVRLTWRGAGQGEIAEAELLTSPTGSSRKRRPALVLSHPGEGVDSAEGVYLRGFLDPIDGGRPALSVDGAPAAIERDGAFGVFVPHSGPAGEPWQVTLAATFPDGTRVRRIVRLGGKPGGDPDLENVKEEQAAPGEAKSLKLAGARLDVPPGALGQKVALSMRRLASGDLPALDSGMTNVTAEGGGFRMGPHGLRFREPVQLSLPYDTGRIPPGMTEDDVQTFYFDEQTGRWLPIARVGIDAGARVIVSATDHFTDFIAATIALPDEPASESFTPNSLDELATAEPASEITLIEPPEAGPTGHAELSFPLTVPPGRHGLEPALKVLYNSGSSNGWLGVGWDLRLPAIEVSTLFGVPRYDPAHESDTYQLDGEQLAPVADPGAPRAANRIFTRRTEGSFERIVRHGSGPADVWWEVTDQDGVRYLYGRTAQARLSDPRNGNTFRWSLEQVVDPHGNTVDYTYATDASAPSEPGEPWVQIYPARIDYTGSPQGGAFYQVRFNLDGGDQRPDRLSTGMPGFKAVTRRRLESVDVLAGGALVRRWVFAYRNDGLAESFYKSLLESVAVLGTDGTTELARHTFDYFRQERQGDTFAGFGTPETWGGLRGSRDATNTMTWSAGGHGFAGLGPPGCQPHVGIQLGGGGGETTVRSSFFDVDGDGLPDRIDENGNVDRNAFDPVTDQGAFSRVTFSGAEAFGHSTDWNVDFGAGVHAEAGITAALEASWAWIHSSDDRAVADVNGDLRPDLVSTGDGFSVRVNTGSGFAERSSWGGFGGVDLGVPGEEDEILSRFHLADALRKLSLPYSGRVAIGGAVQRKQPGGDGARVQVYLNGSRIWQRTVAAEDVAACEPAPGDACGGGLVLDVNAGDELYFLAGSLRDTSVDDLLWSPRITYLDRDTASREPWGPAVHVFDAAEDFRLAGFRGAGWTAPADGVVRVLGGLSKQTTSDDVTITVRKSRNGSFEAPIYQRTLAAAETGLFDEVPSIPVQAGDALHFEIVSGTPVDPARVAWTPTVTYESGGEELDPGLVSLPAQVSHAVPRLLPASQPTASWTAPEAGSYELSVSWSSPLFRSGPVVLYVQGLHRLFDRRVVDPGSSGASFSLTLDLAAGEPVFVSVLAGQANDRGSLTAAIGGTSIPVNLRYTDPDGRGDVLSGGWHGWFYGEWNGNRAFDPGALAPPADQSSEPDYVSGVPRWEGVEGFRAPVWTAAGFDLRLAGEGVKPSRRGSNVTANLDRSAGGGAGGGGLSVLRQTAGRTASVGVSAGLGLSLSSGSTDAQLDLLDINGDNYADQVSGGGVRFSNGRDGFGPLESLPGLGGAVRSVDDATVGTTAGLGINFVKKNGRGKAQSTLNTLPSVGSTVSLSQVRTDLLDVNGDGLPDRISIAPGSSTLAVQLNLGYRFGAPESWPLPGWAGGGRCQDVVDYVASEVAGELSSLDTLNGISFTRSSAAHVGLAIGPFGGGVVTTLARTLVDLADVNGDGLLDRVAKEHGDPYFRVQLNLGDGWAPEERWSAPDWNVQPGSGYDPGLFRCLDALFFQGNVGGNGSVGAPICIPLVPPFVVAGLQIEVSAQASGGEGGVQLAFQDLDGDGLADHVMKRGGDGNVQVRRNEARKVNLLSTVHRPLGGTLHFDYRRQGNRVDLSDPTHKIDLPHHQWVLASTVVEDGRGNAYETRFDYFNDSYFDRAERESYGFARVLTTRSDGSTIDRLYHNQDFHRRHLLAQESLADAAGRPFRVETTSYGLIAIGPGAAFPAPVREETLFYEGAATPQKTTAKTWEYDGLGNVVAYRDFADEGNDDDLAATVTYHVDPAAWIIQPASIEVRDGAGRLMRRRNATYDAFGDVVRLEQTLTGGNDPANGSPYTGTANAVWTYDYDGLGSLASSVDPTGYTRSFAYDSDALTHPVELRDSFGYVTRQSWDLRFGALSEVIDENGASLRRVYDAFGRLSEVYGPYDAAGSPALRFEYAPAASPAFALAHHKDVTRPDPIDTAVFIDGLGRTLQTKGDTEIDAGSGTSTRIGTRVSGPLVFDSLGRVAAQGQPVFDTQAAGRFVDVPLTNPTTFERDVLDRVRKVRFPHGAETRFDYGFGELDGVARFATVRTDPNGRATRFFHDVQGDLLGVEQTNRGQKLLTRYAFDAMSQLTAATDAKGNTTRLEWDTLGRNVVLDSPDAGRTELRYDRGGNLGARITANLAARGQQIRYLRTFHRLDRVDYPDMPDVLYTYGGPGAPDFRAGRVATVTDESGLQELFYGRLGEVVRRTKTATSLNGGSPKGPFTTTFQFDGFGRLLAVGYPDGETVNYGFDAEGRVKSARSARTDYLTHLGYDEFGDRVRALAGNGVETRWTYNPQSRHLARLTTHERGGRELQDLVYTLDPAGTILGLTNDVPVPAPSQYGGPTSQRFRYDDLYQLVAADGTYQFAPDKTATYSLAFSYDELGNVTAKNQLHQVISGNQPHTEKKTTYDQTYLYGGPRPHAPTRIGGRTFQYDLDGNQTGWQEDANGTRRTLVWNEEDRLAAVADNGQTTRFLYDADGTRSNKAGPHGETIYVDPYFTVRNGAIGSRHVWVDGQRLATKVVPDPTEPSSEKLYFYQADHLGSTHFVTDDRGLAWQHLEYLPSGETWVDERSEKQSTPWQFSGKEMDEETGLNYFGFRYYDARQSQWINPDPILDELLDTGKLARSDLSDGAFHLPGHVYGYVGNDPANLVDPNGLGKRNKYVGSTPSKTSTTGKTVRQRMALSGTLRNYGKVNEQVLVFVLKVKIAQWRKVDKNIHMGHIVDAVRLWNGIGKFFGARHKVVRAIMRDPDNYVLEDGSANMSKGAKMGHGIRYQNPAIDSYDMVKDDPKALADWREGFRKAREAFLSKKEWNQLKKHVPADAH